MHDHRDYMVGLAHENFWRRGVELGLGSCGLFRRLVALGLDMVGVDLGLRPDRRRIQEDLAEMHPCRILWMSTAEASLHVEDGWADFVFVDAGHSYQAVRSDIELWRPKVRDGGWFGGHDYHSAHPGVVRAVDEAFGNRVQVLPFAIWAVRPC